MRILYYLILLPLSLLPSTVLYKISDILYIVLYKIIGYRVSVVRTNIQNSFPEYSDEKRTQIERDFYGHFCDLITESIKAFTISETELEKRFIHQDTEIFEKYFKNRQHITMVGGHSGNWELFAVSIALNMQHQPIALFKPLANKFMNKKIKSSRSKFGLQMKSYAEVKEMINENYDHPMAFIFGADQCPNIRQTPYWTTFLNQETAIQFGTEKFARDNNTPVIYGFINRIKRGHYSATYKLICESPNELPVGEITKIHTRMLEEDIRKEPSFWLWTHKRWKRSRANFEKRQEQLLAQKLSA